MNRTDLARSIFVVVTGAVIYVALWSDFTFANALWGAVFGALTLVMLPLPEATAREARFRPLAFVRYLLHVGGALVVSSFTVIRQVVTPGSRLQQGIIEVPMRSRSHLVVTLVANSVSLTPGTLTLDVATDPMRLYVHVMLLDDVEEARATIRRMEDLALRAFPNTESDDTAPPADRTAEETT